MLSSLSSLLLIINFFLNRLIQKYLQVNPDEILRMQSKKIEKHKNQEETKKQLAKNSTDILLDDAF